MWREETIYANDENYMASAQQLWLHLKGGFADSIEDDNPDELSAQELLVWSSVHGLANLFVDGPLWKHHSLEQKMQTAAEVIQELRPALREDN